MFVSYKTRLAAMQAVFFCVLLPWTAFSQNEEELANESHHARELMGQGRFAEAVPLYQKLVKALPGNAGLLLNLAMAEEMAGQPAQAIPHFQAVLKQQPGSVPALISFSMALLQVGRTGEAIAPLRKAAVLDPSNNNVMGMLADAELSRNEFAEAAVHYGELTKRQEGDPRAWYGLGKAYEALANRTFERLNKAAPESQYVAALLADSRLESRQYRSAFFFYHEAQRQQADLPGIHAGLAQVYRSTEHADWAAEEEKREQALAKPDCRLESAACAFLAGHYGEAVKSAGGAKASASALFWATKAYNQLAVGAFQHLTQLPESVEIHALKAQLAKDRRQDLEAADEWRAALKLAPEDDKLKLQLAAALFDAKDYKGALELAQPQLEKDPKSPELNYLVGGSLFRSEQPDRALPYLEESVRVGPDNLAANASLGLTLGALNKSQEAIPYLKKALPLDDDGSLHYSLARAYRAAGDAAHASEALSQYQQIQKKNQQINEELAKQAEISAPGKQ